MGEDKKNRFDGWNIKGQNIDPNKDKLNLWTYNNEPKDLINKGKMLRKFNLVKSSFVSKSNELIPYWFNLQIYSFCIIFYIMVISI